MRVYNLKGLVLCSLVAHKLTITSERRVLHMLFRTLHQSDRVKKISLSLSLSLVQPLLSSRRLRSGFVVDKC